MGIFRGANSGASSGANSGASSGTNSGASGTNFGASSGGDQTVATAVAGRRFGTDPVVAVGFAAAANAAPTAAAALAMSAHVSGVPKSKRTKLVSAVEAGSPALCWQPFVSHSATRVGRSGLWCLRCFGKPVGPYQVLLRWRCSDERPPEAIPGSLGAALLRAGPLEVSATENLRARHAVLLAAARVVLVPLAVCLSSA